MTTDEYIQYISSQDGESSESTISITCESSGLPEPPTEQEIRDGKLSRLVDAIDGVSKSLESIASNISWISFFIFVLMFVKFVAWVSH